MPITYKKAVAYLEGDCIVEEAEQLFEWLQEHRDAKVNLKQVTHLHSAVLQVLMAMKPAISAPPQDAEVAVWLLPALASKPQN